MEEKTLIYCVDDEEPIREVYKYALEGAGFNPVCFSCADELFAGLTKAVPKLIILDVMLEGMDGYAILEKIRANPSTKNVPVIMVSAKTTEIDKVRGLNLGADDYISKPFGILELVARINANIRKTATVQPALKFKDITVDDGEHVIKVGDSPVNTNF